MQVQRLSYIRTILHVGIGRQGSLACNDLAGQCGFIYCLSSIDQPHAHGAYPGALQQTWLLSRAFNRYYMDTWL